MNKAEAKTFSQRFNEALDIRKCPALGRGRINYVQEIFEISRAGANKWLHGKAIPHPKKRLEIALKLKINLKWLELGEGSPLSHDEISLTNMVQHIPLLSMRQIYNRKVEINTEKTKKIVVNTDIPNNCFAVIHIGSSMEPKFSDNCILIVDPNAKILDGDYVIAETRTLPEVIFRQYIRGSEHNYLIAINIKFEPVIIDEKTVIIGKIIEVRSTL